MTTQEAIEKLKKCQASGADPEIAHWDADRVLCELLISKGCAEVVKEFQKVTKWYA